MDFNNFFQDMMEELNREARAERERRDDESAKLAEMKRKNDEAAETLFELYRSMVNKGFTPPQAMELLKALLPKATFGGHR